MLEIRPVCENCGKELPNDSPEAMICTFECTYCRECVNTVLFNVCPNCGGGFERRPTRPSHWLVKYPTTEQKTIQPVLPLKFQKLLERFKSIDPRKR